MRRLNIAAVGHKTDPEDRKPTVSFDVDTSDEGSIVNVSDVDSEDVVSSGGKKKSSLNDRFRKLSLNRSLNETMTTCTTCTTCYTSECTSCDCSKCINTSSDEFDEYEECGTCDESGDISEDIFVDKN